MGRQTRGRLLSCVFLGAVCALWGGACLVAATIHEKYGVHVPRSPPTLLPPAAALDAMAIGPRSPSKSTHDSHSIVQDCACHQSFIPPMNNSTTKKIISSALAATLCAGTILSAGDGTGEAGFVPPPRDVKKPPAPPRVASSAESVLACCCCPGTPMSRTEAKKPPQPPVLITKIKEEAPTDGKK